MREIIRNPAGGRKGLAARLLLAATLALGLAACDESLDQSASNDQGPPATSAPSKPPPAPSNTYRLVGQGKVLVDSAGTRIPIDPKLITGYIDSVTPNGDVIDLGGWAAPADLSKPADVAVAIVGKKSVVAVAPSGERPDLVKGYDRPGLERAGFALSIPTSSLDCSAPDQGLKTFAVAGDVAGPLEWLATVPEEIANAC